MVGINRNNNDRCDWDSDIAINSRNNIICDQPSSLFVSEVVAGRISVFNAETGQLIRRFGESGTANGQFRGPSASALATDSENNPILFIRDEYNNRIQVHNPFTGEYLRTIDNGRGPED